VNFLREEALNEEPMVFLEDLKCYELCLLEAELLEHLNPAVLFKQV